MRSVGYGRRRLGAVLGQKSDKWSSGAAKLFIAPPYLLGYLYHLELRIADILTLALGTTGRGIQPLPSSEDEAAKGTLRFMHKPAIRHFQPPPDFQVDVAQQVPGLGVAGAELEQLLQGLDGAFRVVELLEPWFLEAQ